MTGSYPGGGGAGLLQQDPRLLLAQQLMGEGSSTKPVYSPLEGIARALTGAMGGLQAGEVRQQSMEGLNKAMRALEDPSEPNLVNRLSNASAEYRTGNPYNLNDPFQAQILQMLTKTDKVGTGERVIRNDPKTGKPMEVLPAGIQSKEGQQFQDALKFAQSLPDDHPAKKVIVDTLMASGAKGALASERDTQKVSPTGDVQVVGAGTPEFKGKVAGAVTGAQEGAKYPYELGKAGYLKNLEIWGEKNKPTLKSPEQAIVQPSPEPMPSPPVPVPGVPAPAAAPRAPVAAVPQPPAPTPAPAPGAAKELVPGMTPAQVTEQKGQGENLAALSKKIDEESGNAAEMKQRIPLLQSALQTIRTGVTGPAREAASRLITEVAGPEWATKITKIDPGNVALFNSEAINLVAEMVKQLGSREAQSIYQNVGKSKPNVANTEEGNRLIMGSIDQMATRAQDKRTARDAWLSDPAHGHSLEGFADWFDKSHRPEVYASRVIPLAMPGRKEDAVPGAVYTTPKGSALWTGNGWQLGGQPTIGMGAQ